MNERIKAGANIHAGDGGYSIGTQERYEQFAKERNRVVNERIKQLAMQANNHHDNFFDLNYKELDMFMEKFAELIVRECIDYCGENLSKTVGGALKIHFGVKE